MSLPNTNIPNQDNPIQNTQTILDLIAKQQQMDKVQALLKLLAIEQLDIDIAGEMYKILNLELITEYTGKDTTKFMVKNETWRKSYADVYHCDINDEQLVGYMDVQIMLKMISHRRKRVTEIIYGLKNEIATSEVIPNKTRTKRFFGMI